MTAPAFVCGQAIGTMSGPMISCPKRLMKGRTDDGRVFRTLNILDEFSRECLVIRVERKLNSTDVIDILTDLFILRGPPGFIRSPSH